MNNISALLIIILLFAVKSGFTQPLAIPKNYTLVDSVSGDLDRDNINELVVAYNTGPEVEVEGVPRTLIIYKKINGKWKEWKRSAQALLGSQDGGVMGDPFGEIQIKNGILHINHLGGSSWKWSFTDKYRFQNGEFYLVGYTSISGKPCEYWFEVDFNLSTGKMDVKKEYEDCETDEQTTYKKENESLYKKGLKITLQKRREMEIKLVTPKYGHKVYL